MAKKRLSDAALAKPADSPRQRAHALIDALSDASVQMVLPYLEFLKHEGVAATMRKTAKAAPSGDSIRRDLGL